MERLEELHWVRWDRGCDPGWEHKRSRAGKHPEAAVGNGRYMLLGRELWDAAAPSLQQRRGLSGSLWP